MKSYYSQIDPRWSRETLGKTIYTIHDWGCTITSICNVIAKLFGRVDFTPAAAARTWNFTAMGELIWGSVKFMSLKWKHRGYGNIPHETATEFTGAGKDVIVRLKTRPFHWVKIHSWTARWIPYFLAVDPYTYNPKFQSSRIVIKRKSLIDGYSLFEKWDKLLND